MRSSHSSRAVLIRKIDCPAPPCRMRISKIRRHTLRNRKSGRESAGEMGFQGRLPASEVVTVPASQASNSATLRSKEGHPRESWARHGLYRG